MSCNSLLSDSFLYNSTAVAFAFKSRIELELSTTIGKGVFMVSNVFLEIIGLINKSKIPKIDIKRNKAKNKVILDLFLTL